MLYLRAPDGRIFDLPAGPATAGRTGPTVPARDSDAPPAGSDPAVELVRRPRLPAALAAFFTERWDTAVDLLARVLDRHPDHPQVTDRLAQAHANNSSWPAGTPTPGRPPTRAAGAQPWPPWNASSPPRATAPMPPGGWSRPAPRRRCADLQGDLRRLHAARQWAAVVAVGEQLAALDPQAADPDGLVTAARAELAEAALADRYTAGLRHLDHGDLAAAEETFAALQADRPDYRDTPALLARIREQASARAAAEQQEHSLQAPPCLPAGCSDGRAAGHDGEGIRIPSTTGRGGHGAE